MDLLGIKSIFDNLQDEESRMVFMYRLQYYLDGSLEHLDNMIKYAYALDVRDKVHDENFTIDSVAALAKRYKSDPGPVVIYGAGTTLLSCILRLESLGIPITCLCDSNPELAGTVKLGYNIISPDELVRDYKDAYIVISPSGRFANEINEFLRQSGYKASQIIYFATALRGAQYFDLKEFFPVKDEIYVDAGCLNGMTIKRFIDFCGGDYKKIYAMEPDPDNFKKTIKHIKENGYHGVQLVEKGAWSSDAVLSFSNASDGSSQINEDGDIKIPVTSIDKMVGGDAVTFIKMDIEGAELEALKGAENTIKKHRPKLAVCVYHKPEDILTIPGYIREIAPGYKFYLRHHSTSRNETVLYAAP